MQRVVTVLSLLLAFGLGTEPQDHPDAIAITLERTECFGSCPSYKVTIRGDGSVVYEGYKDVRIKGMRKIKVDAAEEAKLVLKNRLEVDDSKHRFHSELGVLEDESRIIKD